MDKGECWQVSRASIVNTLLRAMWNILAIPKVYSSDAENAFPGRVTMDVPRARRTYHMG